MTVISTAYFGSKRQHLDFILPLLPQTGTYVEPFGGSAAVLLNRPRSEKEVYSDLNPDACALMRVLRDRREDVQRAVRLTPYSRTEFTRACAEMPDVDDEELERARRLLVRNYQGVFATIRALASNWGRQLDPSISKGSSRHAVRVESWRRLPPKHDAAGERLQGVEIVNGDAIDVMRKHDSPDTLFYLDPPYVLSTRTHKKAYYKELADSEHAQLVEALGSIEGKVAVSGYDSPLYDELFDGWTKYADRAKNLGATNITTVRTEVLWTNYEARL